MIETRQSALLGVVVLVTCEMNARGQQWIRQFGTNEQDQAIAPSPDGADGVIVVGTTRGSLGGQNMGDNDAFRARYDIAGNQLWIRQFGTVAHDALYAGSVDRPDLIFVGGFPSSSLESSSRLCRSPSMEAGN